MGMTREIQRTLERSLPQYVLDYLNDEFLKREESFAKVKELEARIEKLLTEVQERDRVLWQAFKNIGTTRESSSSRPMGFSFGGYNRPDYDLDIPYMQRGGRGGRGGGGNRGGGRNEAFPGIYAQGGGGSGGGSGGSGGSGSSGGSSGGGGTSAHFKEYIREEQERPIYEPPVVE